MAKRIGLLYGMEREFPAVLAQEINKRGRGEVVCEPLVTGAPRIDRKPPYDLILDRISHEVPFYRTYLKECAFHGTQVVNNPFWFSADDKYFGTIVAEQAGVAVPRTVLLPHKRHPPGTEGASFSNLRFPLEWEEVFDYLKFPIYLKPAYGGGWKHVYRCANPDEFFHSFEQTGDLCMMAQEEIVFEEYYRCYVLGREHVHLMRYDPKAPFHERYVRNPPPIDKALKNRMDRDCRAICKAASPTPPQPNTATASPARIPPARTAAPYPVITPQPTRHTRSSATPRGIRIAWPAATRTTSAKPPIPM